MNIKPEQIPDEVVEIATEAYRALPARTTFHDSMKAALAAALPALLGEPVAFVDPSDLLELKRGGCGGITCGTYSKRYGRESPLYALPTQDTTNE